MPSESCLARLCPRATAAALALVVLAGAGGARAESIKFCKLTTDPNCVSGEVRNESWATVTKVRIKQLADDGCEALDRVSKTSLGGGYAREGTTWNTACTYKIQYSTTDNCTGDKDGKIGKSDYAAEKSAVVLKGTCGKLRVKVDKTDRKTSSQQPITP